MASGDPAPMFAAYSREVVLDEVNRLGRRMDRRQQRLRLERLAALLAATAFAPAVWATGVVQFADDAFELWEGEQRFLGVVRTGDTSGTASVVFDVDVAAGTAMRDVDFRVTPATGVLNFADGETFKLITVTAVADTVSEDTEHARLVLSAPVGATLGAQSELALWIREPAATDSNFDFMTGTAVRIGDTVFQTRVVLVGEGDGVSLEVSRDLTTDAGSVDVTVVGGSATRGVDYVDPTTTLSFAAGASSASLTLSSVDDAASEGLESVELLLTNGMPPGGVARTGRALVLIDDDEPPAAGRFSLEHSSLINGRLDVREDGGPVTFRVVREGGADGGVTVDYTTLDGRVATFGRRGYAPATGTLVFGDGVTEQSFSVSVGHHHQGAVVGAIPVVLVNATGGAAIDPRSSSATLSVIEDDTNCIGCFQVTGNCFIATAAYGSYLDPHVAALRAFRDHRLLTNAPGRAFVAWYYRVSPPLADVIRRNVALRVATRAALTPVVLAVVHPLWTLVVLIGGAAACGCVRRRRLACGPQ
jgi:hypothetical protein